MKKIATIILIVVCLCVTPSIINAQGKSSTNQQPFGDLWKKIDSLLAKRANADSTISIVNKINIKAKTQNDIPSIVKTIYYKTVLLSNNNVKGRYDAIAYVESELKQSKGLLKPVLQSILADLYLKLETDYSYSNNKKDSLTDDIRLWSRNQLRIKVNKLLLSSLSNEQTKTVDIRTFDVLDGNAFEERPTLFDYLAYFAADNYQEELWGRFIKFDPQLFSVDNFLSKPEPKYIAQSIYYRLLKFHQQTNNNRTFAHAEVQRLKHLKNDLVYHPDLDSSYVRSLVNLSKRYINSDAYVEIAAALATQYWQEFTSWFYDYNSTTKIDACEKLVDKALTKKLNSPAFETCKNIKKNLSASYLEIEMDQAYYPETPVVATVKSRNVSKLNVIIKGNSYYKDSTINISKASKTYYEVDLVTVTKGLPEGKFDLKIHGGIDTDTLTFPIVINKVLSYGVTLKDSLIGVTVNRKTGHSIPNVPVLLDDGIYTSDSEKVIRLRSDNQGIYSYKFPNNDYARINIEIEKLKTRYEIWPAKVWHLGRNLIFTDRAVYRPGQTVYYKSISLEQDGANNFYQTSYPNLYIFLSNGRKIVDESPKYIESSDGKSKIVYGKFDIPIDAALGEAMISSDNSRKIKTIHIEEYKRPTFEVIIDSLTWDTKQKKTCISGYARGYVGQSIDSAKVTFSVKYPKDTTVACYTNQQGFFNSFIAKKNDYHNLDINVTSKSGETQSKNFTGYAKEPLSINLYISDTINIAELPKLSINSGGNFTKGNINIFRLTDGKYKLGLTIPYEGKGNSSVSIKEGIKSLGKYKISYKTKGKEFASLLVTVINKGDSRTVFLDKEEYEIGDTATLSIITPKNIQAQLFFEKNGKLWKHFQIDTSHFQYKIPITKFEQIGYQIITTSNFKTTENSGFINISDKITRLKIELLSYRNKLLPNSNEKWSVKVTDYKGKPVVADITAAMYDASLDSYFPNVWLTNSLYFPNRHFSQTFHVDSKQGKEIISAWTEDKTIWYSSLMGWNFIPRQPSHEPIHRIYQGGEMVDEMVISNFSTNPIETISRATNILSTVKFPEIQIRRNIGETIFFYPTIKTDSSGCANISFQMNEALTRWHFMLFAITGDLHYGFTDSYSVSQKPLMVKPNPPRFLREGDKTFFTTSIINMSDSTINGKATIEFFDLETLKVLNNDLLKENTLKNFNVGPNKTTNIQWEIQVPVGKLEMIGYRIKAASGSFSDGEENALPILSNRELFTESFSFNVAPRSNEKYIFKNFEKNHSNSVQNHSLSFEIVKNPLWEVLTTLPYLMTYPYGCSEQKMNKLYANILALNILNKNIDVRTTMDTWVKQGSFSPLTEDSKLKETLTEESPWFSESANESNQKANIAKLYNIDQLRANISEAISELKEQQLPNGFFPWMPGGNPNYYITQLITEKILHLQNLGINLSEYQLDEMLKSAWKSCDNEFSKEYATLKNDIATGKERYEANHLSPLIIHQLYTNSFLKGKDYYDASKESYQYYLKQGVSYFEQFSVACQGMIALSLYRSSDSINANKILDILKETAFKDKVLGMSWNYSPWFWYALPIESQSVMIEAFHEIKKDKSREASLKLWLLKNKEANRWSSTKATASAIYVLLMIGDKLPMEYNPFEIQVGEDNLSTNNKESGYVRKQWMGDEITKSKASVKINNPNDYQTWGNMNWQYFEDIEKVGASNNESLLLTKLLFREESGKLIQIHDSSTINVGDKIIVRLIIDVKRDMEFVFLKDHRCSGFEPEHKLSGYRWGEMCRYYESVRDASNQFFFDELRRGKYTIEYSMFANLKGSYNNGYANIECMYAPSIRSRTESMHINIRSKK